MSFIKERNPAAPDLTLLLSELKADIFKNLNCHQIGVIEEFFPSNQTATIRFVLKQVQNIAPDGTITIVEHPLLKQVPVMMLYGGGSYLTMPIAPGDNCILFFNDRQIEEWFLKGGIQTPNVSWSHDYNDAIAFVGIKNLQNSISNYLANGVRLAFNATSKIDLTEDAINSIAELWTHTGDMLINGNLTVDGNFFITGDMYGEGSSAISIKSDVVQQPGKTFKAGNGATGTYNIVTVVNGIVTGGS